MLRSRLHKPSPAMVVALVALVVALGGTTYAATGGNFILGQSNTAGSSSSLTAPIAGKALQLTNPSTGSGATALGLTVGSGRPPLTTNSATKVDNLNADRLDGHDSSYFLPVFGTAASAANGAYRMFYDDPPEADIKTVLTIKEMTIRADCVPGVSLTLYVDSTVPAGIDFGVLRRINTGANPTTPEAGGGTANFSTVLAAAPSGTFQRAEGQLVYSNANRMISVTFHAVANSSTNRCQLYGTAVPAPG